MNLSLDARVATDRPLSVMCELKKWVDRETAVAAIGNLPQLNGGIALCLTVYNEPAEALYASISGLSDSIRYLHRSCPDVVVSICILVDGLSKCSSSVRAVLDRFADPISSCKVTLRIWPAFTRPSIYPTFLCSMCREVNVHLTEQNIAELYARKSCNTADTKSGNRQVLFN